VKKLTFLRSYLAELGDSQYLEPERAAAVVNYLKSFPVVVRTTARQQDFLSDSGAPVVPSSFRTDGEWVWNGAVEYYIEKYLVSPGSEFLEYLDAIGFRHDPPTDAEIQAAADMITG